MVNGKGCLIGLLLLGVLFSLAACGERFTQRGDGVTITDEEAVVHWREFGGIPVHCGELVIYANGDVQAFSCDPPATVGVGEARLQADEQDRLDEWIDTYEPFEYQRSITAITDSVTVTLTFTGTGTTVASESDQLQIESLAGQLYQHVQGDLSD
jgi:hypothetical protein